MQKDISKRISWVFLFSSVIALGIYFSSDVQVENQELQKISNLKAIAKKSPKGLEKRIVFFSEKGIVATASCFGFEDTLCSEKNFISPVIVNNADILIDRNKTSVIKRISIVDQGDSYEKTNFAAEDYFYFFYSDSSDRRGLLLIFSCLLFALFFIVRFFNKNK